MIIKLIKGVLLALSTVISADVTSQNNQAHYALTNPNFQNYTMSNGLPSNFCYKTIQDKYGYIWFATYNGLAKFDGYHFTYYQQQSKNSNYKLPSNWVIDITADSSGNIWINTDAGICKYDPQKNSIIPYLSKVRGWGKINFVQPNKIFVSSYAGIDEYSVQKDSLIFIKNFKESSNNVISSMSSIGNILIATPEDNPSLITIANGKINYLKELELNGKKELMIINSVTPIDQTEMYLNTKKFGLLSFNLKNSSCKGLYSDKLNKNTDITCSIPYDLGHESYVFIGTNGQGVYVINTKGDQAYQFLFTNTTPNSILSNNITGLFVDNNNGVWISTVNGVSYFHPSLQKNKSFYFHNNSTIPENAVINVVHKTDSRNILIGTESSGLFNYDLQSKTTESLLKTPSIQVNSLLYFSKGYYLIATNQGVLKYTPENKNIAPLKIQGRSFTEFTLKIKSLNDSLIGFCTKEGVWLYNQLEDKAQLIGCHDADQGETPQIIKDIYLDSKNNLWILSFFNGYFCYNLESKKKEDLTPKTFIGKPINYQNIVPSKNKEFLLISSSAGIIIQYLNEKKNSTIVNSENGLEGDIIENVQTDLFSNSIYYTTPVGLYKFNINTKQNVIIYSFENYKPKWFNCLEWSSDSLLMLSVSNYFIFSNPILKFKNTKIPSNQIESITINGAPCSLQKKELIFSNDENNLAIEISANVFPQSDKNLLYYSLNNEDWQVSKIGNINLYNLKAGAYYLNYYIKNNESVYSSRIRTLRFEIKEVFYDTTLFKSCILCLIGTILWLIYYYKRNSNHKLVIARQQISRDLHDELGANVSSINIMAKLISNKIEENDSLKPYIQSIANYSMAVSNTINDIIWNINPRFNTLEELINKITKYTTETLEASKINYKINVTNHLKHIELPDRIKYNIYLIAKEAINNSAKYSQAKDVEINISMAFKWFSIEIKDNGIGFDESAYNLGNGLLNMKKRAEEIKAGFDLSSKINNGTKINLSLKIS